MYYFMPKAADRPVFSYKLSILHFWSLVFLYIWAGPHHLHYTALPDWASTLGMLFSLMLIAPSWGGMINGLLTLRGAWNKVVEEPVLKFFVVAVTAYGMSTLEGPVLSIKTVNSLAHYTDWIIAHVHTGALGWNGFLTFGMVYWLAPRLFQTQLYSKRLAELHFWIATFGILLYVASIYSAGITQGLMWRAFDETGRLQYPDFVETTMRLLPMYWVRVAGGTLYLAGMVLFVYNVVKTWGTRPATYDVAVVSAAPLTGRYEDPVSAPAKPEGAWARFISLVWHRSWERLPLTFTVLVVVAVAVASLFEIIPTFLIKSNVPTIASVKPYTPLELAGRDLYIREGCFNCHSQMIRPFRHETERYGEYSKPGESVYDHPFLWGSRRIGPDLAREGGKYPALWHVRHMADPRALSPKSIMPAYAHLEATDLDFGAIQKRVDVMAMLGVPYGDAVNKAPQMAHDQAKVLADEIVRAGGPAGLESKEIVALVAYLERLGTDIRRAPAVAQFKPAPAPVPPGGR
jgi:cytochrome c oxidase cbb3-type subunit I/II